MKEIQLRNTIRVSLLAKTLTRLGIVSSGKSLFRMISGIGTTELEASDHLVRNLPRRVDVNPPRAFATSQRRGFALVITLMVLISHLAGRLHRWSAISLRSFGLAELETQTRANPFRIDQMLQCTPYFSIIQKAGIRTSRILGFPDHPEDAAKKI
ncbi:MAG: hypothetical protein ACRDBP_14105 [Luteolibacter sp.]